MSNFWQPQSSGRGPTIWKGKRDKPDMFAVYVAYEKLTYTVFLESHNIDIKLLDYQHTHFPQKEAKANIVIRIIIIVTLI